LTSSTRESSLQTSLEGLGADEDFTEEMLDSDDEVLDCEEVLHCEEVLDCETMLFCEEVPDGKEMRNGDKLPAGG
jgi:hypothetical protein